MEESIPSPDEEDPAVLLRIHKQLTVRTMTPDERSTDADAVANASSVSRECARLGPWALLVLALVCLSIAFVRSIGTSSAAPSVVIGGPVTEQRMRITAGTEEFTTPPPPRALVTYVFSNNDPNYLGNLAFFIKTAVRAHQAIDYVFVLNQGFGPPPPPANQTEWNPNTDSWRDAYVARKYLPELPPNAIYVDHPNECNDLGTVGWFLDSADYARALRENGGVAPADSEQPAHWNATRFAHVKIDTRAYRYFFWINASVRGPILPAYFDLESRHQYWYYPFLRMMQVDPMIKLVGCTMGCKFSPHIQSYVLFTDDVGCRLIRSGPSLDCSRSRPSAIIDGEIGTSWTILAAGYNIGSLAPSERYLQYGDDRDPKVLAEADKFVSHHCDAHPSGDDTSANNQLNPYDTVFHKHQTKRPTLLGADELVHMQEVMAERIRERAAGRQTPTPVSEAAVNERLERKKKWIVGGK